MHLLTSLLIAFATLITFAVAADTTVETIFYGTIFTLPNTAYPTTTSITTGLYASIVTATSSSTVYAIGCAPTQTWCSSHTDLFTILVTIGPSTMMMDVSQVVRVPIERSTNGTTSTYWAPPNSQSMNLACKLRGTTTATCVDTITYTWGHGPLTHTDGSVETLTASTDVGSYSGTLAASQMAFVPATVTAGLEKLQSATNTPGAANVQSGGAWKGAAGAAGVIAVGMVAL